MTFWKRQNRGESKQSEVATGLWHVQGTETMLCDTVITLDTCQYAFVKAPKKYNTKSKSQCKPWASVINNALTLALQNNKIRRYCSLNIIFPILTGTSLINGVID